VAEVRERALDAAQALLTERGYGGTTVDRIIERAQVSTGGFFHHFSSKEEAATAALERYFDAILERVAATGFMQEPDPVRRCLSYVDSVEELARGDLFENGCLIGTLSQEVSVSHPRIGHLTGELFDRWIDFAAGLFRDAVRPTDVQVDARALAEMLVVLVEGALIVRKARGDDATIQRSFQTYRRMLTDELSGKG
jgi:TetR/AcrR family transcriptional regulator, transcriptional repressor for nem operon